MQLLVDTGNKQGSVKLFKFNMEKYEKLVEEGLGFKIEQTGSSFLVSYSGLNHNPIVLKNTAVKDLFIYVKLFKFFS
ncbi:hypothetical protein [Fulvivirga sp.]|uniref:hypothetical protein n=1 Tax=Fulvivirga sp. TaxID=1931237 RepID=UPI0032EAF20E